VIQALVKKGKVIGEVVPAPVVSDGCLLIQVVNSCISAGTELTSVQTSKKSLIKRAMEQPEEVKKVLDFVRSNGIEKAYLRVKGVMDTGKPTGYSIAGRVIAVGKGVTGYEAGDCVAAAGAGIANHAEFVDVPVNLAMKMPEGMSFEHASTVTLGGIAMQGVRRADLRMGEICVVVGAGILGLLALQMLKMSGVRVIVADLDESRLQIALQLGADKIINPSKEDAIKIVESMSGGYGADAVLFTAATSSSEPLSQAFKMCRRKGRVVLVGVVGMEINRGDIYAKELDFLISTSYGPGRYDSNYEERGMDYPYAYVRWTENRNMTEYLRMVHEGHIDLKPMIAATYNIEQVTEAFDALQQPAKPIIVILSYSENLGNDVWLKYKTQDNKIVIKNKSTSGDVIKVALVGAGNFATGMHLPNMKKLSSKFSLQAVMSRSGNKAKAIAEQYGAAYATANYNDILTDKDVDLVMIATRHDSHASLALQALQAGKHVFVEKPMATTQEALDAIKNFYDNNSSAPLLMTGFNRRFSSFAVETKKHTDKRINPLLIYYRMNAGHIPYDNWVHEHGGRMVGECCHIIDLMTFLTASKIKSVSVEQISPANDKMQSADNKAIILKYHDGSVCTIHYFTNGSKQISKEYMEVNFDGNTIIMDDYKTLRGFGIKINDITESISCKGQIEELQALHKCMKENKFPIELWDMVQTTEISFVL